MEEPKRKRRWYQFSLRTLFLLTAVVALVCGQIIAYRNRRIDAMFEFIEQWPDCDYAGEGYPCLHPLSSTARRLQSSFPVQLSKQKLGTGPEGFWVGCKRTETDDGLTRWVGICTVEWKAGEVVQISRYTAILPTVRSGDLLFLYWDPRDREADDYHPWHLRLTPSQYLHSTSFYHLLTVDYELLDPAHYRLITLAEFESLVDGTRSADGYPVDEVTLSCVERLRAGKLTFHGQFR